MRKLLATLLLILFATAPTLHADSIEEVRKSAEQGDKAGQFRLGQRYEAGKGVKRDLDKAADWYRKAAEKGFIDAQTNIGIMYYDGQGVPRDHSEAAKWFQLAARQGDTESLEYLGRIADERRLKIPETAA